MQIEGIIYGELIGDPSVTCRTDYSTVPKNGFHKVTYQYDNGDTFTLIQGATSRETGEMVEVIPGSGIMTPVTKVYSTGQLKHVIKEEPNN